MRDVFVDTSPFLNLILGGKNSEQIADYLNTINLRFHTSVTVLNELKYKLLFSIASKELKSDKKYKIIKHIKKNKELTKKVYSVYYDLYSSLLNKFRIHSVFYSDEELTMACAVHHNLLPSDASILATMKQNNIKKIFTFDSDFEKIKDVEVVKV